ncbi:hypothetical protein BDQ12DRAFT_631544 [Crucibulum laeve]|uniref:Uncharacterized protein n=1 Tax=Crucibulum laeve TaxID=68775 RepID=A0A5C3LZF5_9AGAR|nr:hypothetical protein BDQ12DRAFT_631544 [Crucibulum laeve]
MTTDTAPFARFSRIGFGLGLKSSPKSRSSKAKGAPADEDWYIPYNGPYEAPREPLGGRKERDSWGDPVYEDGAQAYAEGYGGEDEPMLDDRELHKRYGDYARQSGERSVRDRTTSVVSGRTVSSGAMDPSRASMSMRRSTVSSGTRPPIPSYINLDAAGGVGESPMPNVRSDVESNRLSFASIFGFRKQPSLNFTEPDRSQKRAKPGRMVVRTEPTSPSMSSGRQTMSTVSNSVLRGRSQPILSSIGTSDEDYYNSYYSTLIQQENATTLSSQPNSASGSSKHPGSAGRESASPTSGGLHPYAYTFPKSEQPDDSPKEPQTAPPTSRSHPIHDPGPSNQQYYPQQKHEPPRLMFTHPPSNTISPQSADAPYFAPIPGPSVLKQQLKSSVSTPNLRSSLIPPDSPSGLGSRSPSPSRLINLPHLRRPPLPTSVPKGRERWLSAETWCDALLFPRPRLKVKRDAEKEKMGSGRIVSPPGSPLGRDFGLSTGKNGEKEQGMASRVLAYSRSLVDLGQAREEDEKREREKVKEREGMWGSPRKKEKERERSRSRSRTQGMAGTQAEKVVQPSAWKGKEKEKVEGEREGRRKVDDPFAANPIGATGTVPVIMTTGTGLRPPRPKSWAQDDLALPSPVPSLARVLEEGAQLQSQRKQWQAQATESFANRATRSVSRARSKSLTAKGKKIPVNYHQSNMDFLAARACLGNQDRFISVTDSPPIPAKVPTSMHTDSTRPSHSHSNSLVKTLTKSSKTHSRSHSRGDSWSKSALKMAKNTVAICGFSADGSGNGMLTPHEANMDERGSSLEHALRREGTRVIRLADPAQIPVDKGLPITPIAPLTMSPRVSPTPSGSAMSDSRVGIALSTPPLVDDTESIRIPAHPYAQGGMFSYSTAANASDGRQVERGSDYAGPHLSAPATAATKLETSEVAARHKLPPHIVLHPYAAQTSSAAQDSYQDDKLITQIRHDSNVPPPAKMWAQLSPGVVREILPSEIQYSPFMPSQAGDSPTNREARNSNIITDTVGVGEALAYASLSRRSRDSGLGTSEDHEIIHLPLQQSEWQRRSIPEETSPEIVQRVHRLTVMYDTRPQYDRRIASNPSNHTLASSPLVEPAEAQYLNVFNMPVANPSLADTSGSSSSYSPRPLGSPNDLDNYHDLFYRPTHSSTEQLQHPLTESARDSLLPDIPKRPWDLTHRRTGSGLTTLARQLSEEFDAMAIEREQTNSQYSQSSPSISGQSISRRPPTDGSLAFVLEEVGRSESPTSGIGVFVGEVDPMLAFKPSVSIPEDIESSRASTPMEKIEDEDEEDNTAMFRVGMVESVSTPPATYSDHRMSMMGDLSFSPERHRSAQPIADFSPIMHSRVMSGLQPPSADPTRSSYTTSSTASRMSGLSDFPVPPKDLTTSKHTSLLSSYFDEALTAREARGSRTPTPPLPSDDRRLTYAINEAEELLAVLSSTTSRT